jgi:phosphotransacetylase
MELLEQIRKSASKKAKQIVFPEGQEDRMIKAAERLRREQICQATLLGPKDIIKEKAKSLNVSLDGICIIDPQESETLKEYSKSFFEIRRNSNQTSFLWGNDGSGR